MNRYSYLFKIFVMCILIANCVSIEINYVVKKEAPLLSASIPSESSPGVSAVLLECPKEPADKSNSSCNSNPHTCEPQLMVNIRVNPSFHIDKIEKFLILDEVFDPQRREKAKIMSPYLIEISRGEPIMMYPLEFAKSVKCNKCDMQNNNNNKTQSAKCDETLDVNDTKVDQVDLSHKQEYLKPVIENKSGACAPAAHSYIANGNTRMDLNDDQTNSYVTKNRNPSHMLTKETEKIEKGNDDFKNCGHHVSYKVSDNKKKSILKMSNTNSGFQSFDKNYFNADQTTSNEELYKNLLNHLKYGSKRHMGGIDQSNKYTSDSSSDRRIYLKPLREVDGIGPQRANINSVWQKNIPKELSTTFKINELKTYKNFPSILRSQRQKQVGAYNEDNIFEGFIRDNRLHRSLLKRRKYNCGKKRASHYNEATDSENFKKNFEVHKNKQDQLNNYKDIEYLSHGDLKNAITGENTLENSGLMNSEVQKRSEQYELKKNIFNFKHSNQPLLEDVMSPNSNKDTLPYLGARYRHGNNNNNNINRGNNVRKYMNSKQKNFPANQFKLRNTENTVKKHFNKNVFNQNDLDTTKDISNEKKLNHKNLGYSDSKPPNLNQKYYSDGKSTDIKFNKGILDEMSKNKYLKELLNNKDIKINYGPFEEHSEKNIKPPIYDTFSLLPAFGIGLPLQKNDNPDKTAKLDLIYPSIWFGTNPGNQQPEPIDSFDKASIGKNELSQNYYSSAITDPGRSSRHESISPVHNLYSIPPSYRNLIEDQNLNVNDKLKLMEYLNTHNDKINLNPDMLEIGNPFLLYPSYPSSIHISSKPKIKRSILYNDGLQMRDTLNSNDNNIDYIDKKISLQRHVQEDVQPCASCGGKGKKPHGKSDSSGYAHINPCECKNYLDSSGYAHINPCECKNYHDSCTCDPNKMIRSVSDTWYSVFNMSAPLPFLTTKIQIYRKRQNTWWKIVPSITLNSLSGIFANANLSILFSSHVDIFQLEKSLRIQNHQLVIPKDNTPIRQNNISFTVNNGLANSNLSCGYDDELSNLKLLNTNPSLIVAIDKAKINLYPNMLGITSFVRTGRTANSESNFKILTHHPQYDSTSVCTEIMDAMYNSKAKVRDARSYADNGIFNIAELGYFPTTMNILEHCPNDKNRLCLNMLDDRVPAYSIKVKMLFRENTVIYPKLFKVKIAGITADATTKDALQVSVRVINEGLKAEEFSIGVFNCPTSCAGAKTTVEKILLPHIAESITYLLPLIMDTSQKNKKFECDVTVKATIKNDLRRSLPYSYKNENQIKKPVNSINTKMDAKKLVASRNFLVEPEKRCFCVWACSCHCAPKLETHLDFNVCQKLAYKEELRSGLLLQSQSGDDFNDSCLNDEKDDHRNKLSENSSFKMFFQNAFILLLIMLLFGLLKAVLGYFCIKHVDFWGYDYIQPYKGYEKSSKCRRFFMNTLFFIIFPFLFWCKCFTPSNEDLLVASTEWQCSLIQKSGLNNSDDEFPPNPYFENSEEEETILTQKIDHNNANEKFGARLEGGQDVMFLHTRTSDLTSAALEQVLAEADDDEDEEANTKYILQALAESRENLKKLLCVHSSKDINKVEKDNIKWKEACQFVQVLMDAQIVYRTFQEPYGNVRNIPFGRTYCLQGYFLPSLGEEYEFVTNTPLAQHRCISFDGLTVEVLRPPVMLCPSDFSRVYSNKLDVFEARDLSVYIPSNALCINISDIVNVDCSAMKLPEEPNLCSWKGKVQLSSRKEDVSSLSSYDSQIKRCASAQKGPSNSTPD